MSRVCDLLLPFFDGDLDRDFVRLRERLRDLEALVRDLSRFGEGER